MSGNIDNEIIIDFSRVIKTLIDNKKTIFICFLIFMGLGILLNLALPKKYTSEAKILVKKTGSTNLSYINPYVISEGTEDGGFGSLVALKNSLGEEIEIIKSPLVIDNVIKENNLKYKKGAAKGNYLSAKDFLRKNFAVSKLKDADIIYISYKSKDPVLSYNVVNSVIDSYKKTKENLNTEKASDDTGFLKKACLKTEKELDSKILELKKYKSSPKNLSNSSMQNLSLLGFYDKRFKQKLKQISDNETDLEKLEFEISQKTEELSSLKKKLEWSSLVKEMSKNTTDLVILQSPEVREKYDFSEPQPLVIFILSLFGWILACFISINFKKPCK